MQNMLTRSLSLLLALVMVLAMVPVNALAAEEDRKYDLKTLQALIWELGKEVTVEQEAVEEPQPVALEKRMPVTRSESYTNTPDDGHTHVEAASERVSPSCSGSGMTAGIYCTLCGVTISGRVELPALEHQTIEYEAKAPTYHSVGWEAYEACEYCYYTTYVEIPKLEVPAISDYDTFLMYLMILEEVANMYVLEVPGKDPLNLMIKYIRTGVDRYNSGSWGIMAGTEDADFAKYVQALEEELNQEIGIPEEMLAICSLKDLDLITLPNGQVADLGHMFGTMDITYHNNCGLNHADVGGWAGDLVDLLEFADYGGVTGSVEEMTAIVGQDYLLVAHELDVGSFSHTDFWGDLDAMMILNTIVKQGYVYDYDNYEGSLALVMMEHFTETLSDEDRADYFLKNRLGGVTTRGDVRDAVYEAYITNKVVSTLEATRVFQTSDLESLRKAVCYAYADFVCRLAGDYVENTGNSIFTVFSTENANLAPGINQQTKMAVRSDGRQIVYYLATADITREDVNVYVNYHDNDPSKGWETQRVLDQALAAEERHSDPNSPLYVENYNVVAAINGTGFNMTTGQPSGLLVMEGIEYSPIGSNGFFGILKDGTAVMGTTQEYKTIYKDQVQEGVAWFGSRLIKDGEIVEGLDDEMASRTAVGITKTGKVVFLVLDGRQEPFSAGGGYATLAQIMLEAGCVQAMNLDGGGSTTFVAQMPGDDDLSVINRPSDGYARNVSTSLIMVSTAPSSTTFDHAVVESDYDYLTPGASVQMSAVGISPSGNTVDIPEGTYWLVEDACGQITEDGVFTAVSYGTVNVYLMLEDTVVGVKTLQIVDPDNLYFTKSSLDAVYGSSSQLPIKLLYQGKEMAFTTDDVVFSVSNPNAGSISGLTFQVTDNENAGVTNAMIYAVLLSNGATASVRVALYKQGELTFDFDQATGGDRELAWDRTVSNSVEEIKDVYIIQDPGEAMEISYILAIDMTHIQIPKRISELTYMLPGADVEGATAWTFLCQLAERISPLTQINATVTYDANFEADISQLKVINQYFVLTDVIHDTENCTITLVLNWKKQTQAIDLESANPMCIVNGVKLTPKADAQWSSDQKLVCTLSGDVGYKVYMRATALHSFAQKPENQEIFGIYDYINPENTYDAGGYFQNTYKQFSDSFTLVNAVKTGWYTEDGGFAYYVNGEKVTGVYCVDGYYYNFGDNGINAGKTKYTGLLQSEGKTYYASLGSLKSGWQTIGEDYYYFNPTTYQMHTGVSRINGLDYTFNAEGVLTRGVFVETAGGTRYYWAGRYLVSRWIELEEGVYRADQNGYIAYGNYPVILSGREDCVWWEFDEKTGIRIGLCDGFIQRDGATYYCENGVIFYGAVQTEGGIVYCGTNGKVPVNGSCYVSENLDYTAGLETGYYKVGADGYIVKDGFATVNGSTYYFTNYIRTKGFAKIGDKYYFFNAGNGKMFRDASLWVSGNNPYGIASGYYYFQADGTMYVPDPNGEKKIEEQNGKLYLTVDGVKQTNGLNELDGEYYYANSNGTLAVNTVVYMSKFNDLIAPGNGYFAFGADGKLVKTGFVAASNGYTYYYNDLVRAKGFTKLGDKYYFFNAGSGAMQCDKTLWVGGDNAYGIASGYYYFQADGTMYVPDPNGEKKIVEQNGKLYLTVDGVKQTNGLNELDGEYYYANSNGTLAVNTVVYMSKFNDLIAPGNGYFAFGADGKLVKTGFVAAPNGYTYYYNDLVRAKGFTKLGENYYLFNTGSGAMQCDKTQWVGGDNAYGIASGYYYFQADGTMYVPDPNGEKKIVEQNGKLYLTIDGVKQTNGLNELDGEYYYANSNGTLAVNTVVYMSKFNDLIAPGNGYFAFGADGKLVKTGFVAASNGYTYYYNDLVRVKGLQKIGDDFYYFNTGSGAMFVNTKVWIGGNNAYGLKSGYYTAGVDGKLTVE